jgi:hypothetical protein
LIWKPIPPSTHTFVPTELELSNAPIFLLVRRQCTRASNMDRDWSPSISLKHTIYLWKALRWTRSVVTPTLVTPPTTMPIRSTLWNFPIKDL